MTPGAQRLHRIYREAIARVHPERLWMDHPDLATRLPPGRVWLVAVGKAAPALARAAQRALRSRLQGGLIVALPGANLNGLETLTCLLSSHPIPDARSLEAGRQVRNFISAIPRQDSLLFLLSGGASAMLELPRPPLDLPGLQQRFQELLSSGLDIAAINQQRARFSLIKGGGLIPLCPRRTLTVILSDVLEHPPWIVGSGPTLVAPPAASPPHLVLADVHTLLGATGLPARPRLLSGEARQLGRQLVHESGWCAAAGEATVTLGPDSGFAKKGGRCQELVLAFALEAQGQPFTLLAAGSDGRDGNSDAAGAWADGHTVHRARALGLDLEQALEQHRSYECLQALDQLLPAYDSETNLNDLLLLERQSV